MEGAKLIFVPDTHISNLGETTSDSHRNKLDIGQAKSRAFDNFHAKSYYARKYDRPMLMFTYNHVAAHRAEVFEAVAEGDLVSFFVAERSLEPHQERVGEDFAGCSRGNKHRRSETLQPHDRDVATGG
ncbi:unnamed protein product [Euphydryas editha]|uniref:Transposase n=1 Tax=Euphydryas editha TaxID=104508 RepID=A0AAU9U5D1_EUPED|nr:unnamed protein product [Euphydryas editha]